MTDERRVDVAAEAIEALAMTRPPTTYRIEIGALARAVVAALGAHDGDLRERLAGAVEALKFTAPFAPLIDSFDHGIETAARIIRERP